MVVKMLQQAYPAGNWLIREDESADYDRSSITVDNSAGTVDVTLPAGYPMKAQAAALGSLGTGAEVNAASALIIAATLAPCVIPRGEKRAIACAQRGFNVINQNMLPTADYLGVAFTAVTTLGALYVTNLKWVNRVEGTTQMEQAG